MYAKQQYNICVKDSLFAPNATGLRKRVKSPPHAHYKRPTSDKRALYKVWIYLTGKDTLFVKRVKYTLHSSFKTPVSVVERAPSNPNCSLAIWTWGLFKIKVEIELVSSIKMNLEHQLSYDSSLADKTISWKKIV